MSDMKPDLDHLRQEMAKAIKEHSKWFVGAGIVFIGLGVAAILLPQLFTIVAEQFIGWLFLIGGIFLALKSFQAKGVPAALGSIVRAVLSIAVGVLLVAFPTQGVFSLTLLLIAFFAAEGIVRIYMAFKLRPLNNWFWVLLNGAINIVLAFLVWSGLPGTAAWVLGLLVGIDMLFFGLSMIMLAKGAGKIDGGD
ncbi:MAG: HdeD family acid-resistance protein [Pseudomonadota bacterium]